jgi:hypothetical protein
MFTIVLLVILGYYTLNFLVAFSRLAFHWGRAVWSKNVWFDMEIRGHETDTDPYLYFTVIPWFYEETGSHFMFAFNPLGFRTWFVPVTTIGEVLQDHFGSLSVWQVLYDSKRTIRPVTKTSLFDSPSTGTGFSPGTDLMFFSDEDPDTEAIERFGSESGKSIVPGRLVDNLREVFDPSVFLLKSGNRWTVGCKDDQLRAKLMTSLFARVADKIMVKHGFAGTVRVVPRDGADRFIARGQVRWWMKARMEGDSVIIEGDGLRPGEVTSADWAIVTIPVERS